MDGTNGTPDLRDKFIKSIPNNATNPGVAGGANTHNHGGNTGEYVLTINEMPSHNHASSNYNGSGNSTGYATTDAPPHGDRNYWNFNNPGYSSYAGGNANHSHAIANTSNLPPYYELAFIMKQ